MTAIFAIIKRIFASHKVSFIITAVVVLCATTSGDSKIALSNGNYTWLLAVMTPFLFVFYDYTKLMHLGTSKKDYFLGSLATDGILVAIICIFTPVAPLRHILAGLFKVIMFNNNLCYKWVSAYC